MHKDTKSRLLTPGIQGSDCAHCRRRHGSHADSKANRYCIDGGPDSAYPPHSSGNAPRHARAFSPPPVPPSLSGTAQSDQWIHRLIAQSGADLKESGCIPRVANRAVRRATCALHLRHPVDWFAKASRSVTVQVCVTDETFAQGHSLPRTPRDPTNGLGARATAFISQRRCASRAACS